MPVNPEIWIDRRILEPEEALAEDDRLLEEVAAGRRPATLRIWTMPDVVVCPASYKRKWRVSGPYDDPPLFRSTGGGIVAVAQGVTFWSLAFASPRGEAPAIDAAYEALSDRMCSALLRAGVAADVVEIPEAMCRGRYDISIGGRKIAGLSQRRIQRGHGEARVAAQLVHAFLLENADVASIEKRCNRLARHIGVPGTEPGALLSLHDVLGQPVTLENML